MTSVQEQASFVSMGTTVSLIGPRSTDRAAETEFALNSWAVQTIFAAIESRFSRFRTDSELSRVNARSGRWTRVSREFADLLRLSLAAARETQGLFDPTMLAALVAAGYDRDYAAIRRDGATVRQPPKRGPGWEAIAVEGRMVLLPAHVQLDFGGVAKGWAVDRASEVIEGLAWAVVNAGGDLRVVGNPPGGGVRVAVEDPADPRRHLMQLRLQTGAIATSSVLSRTWGNGLHQLIDPRTRLPASTGVRQATVWGPTCAEAEVRSTWAVLEGPAILDRVPGVLVLDDGRLELNLESRDPGLTVDRSRATA